MRVRRNILAPVIVVIGTVGALVSGPVLPAAAASPAAVAAPHVMVAHG